MIIEVGSPSVKDGRPKGPDPYEDRAPRRVDHRGAHRMMGNCVQWAVGAYTVGMEQCQSASGRGNVSTPSLT